MYMMRYLEPLVYVAAFSLVVGAALIIYNLQFIDNKIVYRLRMAAYFRNRSDNFKRSLYDENLEKLLVQAGNPLNLGSIKYNLIRISSLGGWFIYINVWWPYCGYIRIFLFQSSV